jgi:hypothetical protein
MPELVSKILEWGGRLWLGRGRTITCMLDLHVAGRWLQGEVDKVRSDT